MKKISVTTASIAMSLGLVVALGGGVAMASGHGPGSHGPASVTATGTATCTVHGIVIFAADGTVSVRGNITPSHGAGCTVSNTTNGVTSVTKIRNGHFSRPLTSATPTPTSTVPSTSTTTKTCAPVPNGNQPDLANGTIAWNPRPKFAPSSGISLTGGSASAGTNGHLVIAYTSGAVASGSFANSTTSTTVTLTLTSNQTMTQLQARCAGDRFVIAVHGTITL